MFDNTKVPIFPDKRYNFSDESNLIVSLNQDNSF